MQGNPYWPLNGPRFLSRRDFVQSSFARGMKCQSARIKSRGTDGKPMHKTSNGKLALMRSNSPIHDS
jgi:hypothetical protein